ncbi:MAG: FAD-dependent oxidoreductase, partial [Actinomycetota bacterium]|nr:FAD-dependent oxidoreductase [Actinomycetota bacterium]
MLTYDYVVVGNSAAAINACDAIRSLDQDGSLAVFGEEKRRCYSRPLISYLVMGYIDEKGMYYRPTDYYRKRRIDFHPGSRVEVVDLERHFLETSSGERFKWKKLLLATGFQPFIPPVEGLAEMRYLTFVSWDDARTMLRLTARPLRSLVMGAGLIGMKAAEALHSRGCEVVVVEKMDRILPLALDEVASEMVAARCREAGIEVTTGRSVSRVETRGGYRGTAVLDDGAELDFDLLVVAVGVRPRMELAEEAGLHCDRGILVDEHQRTSCPNVFAAGDVAAAFDLVRGEPAVNALWPIAALQGKYAGLNMAGREVPYPGGNSMNAVEFFGLPVLSAGVVNPPDDSYEVIVRRGEDGDYRKVVIQGDLLVGMLVAGKIERAGILTSLIQERANVRRIRNFLLEEGFGHIHFPRSMREERIVEAV